MKWVSRLVSGVAVLMLVTVCLIVNVPRIEEDIRARSAQALTSAGLADVRLEVSGRDVSLTGEQFLLELADHTLAPVVGIRSIRLNPITDQSSASAATPVPPARPAPLTSQGMEDRIRDLISDRAIRFRTGSADLLPASRAILDELAALLRGTSFQVEIEGHTDSTGSAQRNLLLSQQRADAVMAYLASHGVEEHRMTATGVGAARPIATNTTAAGRRLNRRIEFNVTSRT